MRLRSPCTGWSSVSFGFILDYQWTKACRVSMNWPEISRASPNLCCLRQAHTSHHLASGYLFYGSTGESCIYLENQCEHLPCAQTVRSRTEALKASFLSQSPPPLVFGHIRVCGTNVCPITRLSSTGSGSWHIVGAQQIFVD